MKRIQGMKTQTTDFSSWLEEALIVFEPFLVAECQSRLRGTPPALAEAIERVYYAPLDERERRRWHEAFHARRRRWRRAFRRVNRCRGRGAGRLARWRQTWHLGR